MPCLAENRAGETSALVYKNLPHCAAGTEDFKMDFLSTVKGSLLEGFYPEGWDMKKIDECCEIAKAFPIRHPGYKKYSL